MLIGEVVPKNIALAAPAPAALLLAPALIAFTRALRPFALRINAFANVLFAAAEGNPRTRSDPSSPTMSSPGC